MGQFRAVIFDFDGTLARTMEDNFKAWKAATAAYGIELQPEDYYPLEGVQVYELAKRLFARYRREVPDAQELVRRKEQYYLDHQAFALYPGVEEMIGRLRAKQIRIGVVTTGLRHRLNHSVPPGFLEQFDAVVTGDETTKGKPSPEPYLRGAQKLGVRPEDCVVIENAPVGIEAAKRAGAYCVALCTTLDRRYLKGADEIVGSFEALKRSAAIQQLLA